MPQNLSVGGLEVPDGIEERAFQAGGLQWNLASAGPGRGDPVVLLHGFPEYWATWTQQMSALADAGFRAHAPDLPGYGGTAEPASYAIHDLTENLAELLGSLANGPVHLVGHDWGGMLAHAVAARHPERVRSLAVAAAPHPATFSSALADPMQIMKSWYVGFFQVPYVEGLIGTRQRIEKAAPECVTAINSSEEMGRALAYYRENLRPWGLDRAEVGRIKQPGLVMHAERDRYIGAKLMEATAEQFDDLRGFYKIDSAHFLQREKEEVFNSHLLGFLRSL